MPNHVHGIPFLDPTGSPSAENREEYTADEVETGRALSLQWPTRKASWSEPLIFLMK
jgi:hypothetical protein